MSVQALSCAFAVRGVSASEKLVLLALSNYANDQMQCWPSQDRIAADTELSPRTIWASLKGLERQRLVSRAKRKRADGTRSTDVFTLHFHGELSAEPVANSAKSNRNPCEIQSQILRNPIATVATQEPSDNPKKEPLAEPDGFLAWWLAYPRKTAKGSARKAYRAALKKTDAETLLSGLKGHRFTDEARFIPHPATWLNDERWCDGEAPPPGPDPPPTDPWPNRLREFQRNGFWNTTDWGPKPGKPGCQVPESKMEAA